MQEEKGPQRITLDLMDVFNAIKPTVPSVEQYRTVVPVPRKSVAAADTAADGGRPLSVARQQCVEHPLRIAAFQFHPAPGKSDQSVGTAVEMLQISEADTVHASWQAALQRTVGEAGYIDQH